VISDAFECLLEIKAILVGATLTKFLRTTLRTLHNSAVFPGRLATGNAKPRTKVDAFDPLE
jgi:hypothetical protein